jgi:plasmid stabilization system protein ParE
MKEYGKCPRTSPEEDGEVRILLYGHYRIAYLRRKLGDFVDVLGVFHGSLDLDRYLP